MTLAGHLLAACAALAAPPTGDGGPEPAAQRGLSFAATIGGTSGPPGDATLAWQPDAPPVAGATAPAAPFGTEGTNWLTLGAGVAYDLDEATDVNVRVSYSRFIVNDVEVSPELGFFYHDQAGGPEYSVNTALVFRWHLLKGEDWSLFADAGAGFLFSTDSVPPGGSHINFTPRVGIGCTYDVPALGGRLQAGLRWHHVSNARITGDRENPANDAPMIYVGFMIPF